MQSRIEQYNNIQENLSNDKSEENYRGHITKVRKSCSFGVGTLDWK